MRYKPVPEPTALATVEEIQAAIPLVPGSIEDCCARIVDRTPVASRDDARRWLPFLTALGLVEETTAGYVRTDTTPTDASVARAFHDNVYAAREACTVLDREGSLSAAAVAERVDKMPRWEHDRSPSPDRDWRARITDLLEWAVILDLAASTDAGYRWTGLPADTGQSG